MKDKDTSGGWSYQIKPYRPSPDGSGWVPATEAEATAWFGFRERGEDHRCFGAFPSRVDAEQAMLIFQGRVRPEQRELARAEDAWGLREVEGIEQHEHLLQQAFKDVREVTERGYYDQYEHDGYVASHHFSELGHAYKLRLLEQSIDWSGYIEMGMHPDTPQLIMANAVDGKPPERWLEPRDAEGMANPVRRLSVLGYPVEEAKGSVQTNDRGREGRG